jgi:hypothetical protein
MATKTVSSVLPKNISSLILNRFAACVSADSGLVTSTKAVTTAVGGLKTVLLDGAEGEGIGNLPASQRGNATDRFIMAAWDAVLASNDDYREAGGGGTPRINKLWNRAIASCFSAKAAHFVQSTRRAKESEVKAENARVQAATAAKAKWANTDIPELKANIKKLIDSDDTFLWNVAKMMDAYHLGTTVLRLAVKDSKGEAEVKPAAKPVAKVAGKIVPAAKPATTTRARKVA